ncbi:MAG: histidine phosphatase family protein [Deltaproteobacteria bacterium]|nr:histidine phosphatase family protein [Deltaproteobacteria bacterium]
MPSRRALLRSAALAPAALAAPALLAAPADATAKSHAPAAGVVYIVRHAEKAADPDKAGDPPLRPEGEARAQALARALGGVGLVGVWCSAFTRTRATAAPTAQHAGLTVGEHDPHDAAGLRALVHAAKGPCLVVGHSNTVGKLVAALGGPTLPDLAEGEYDALDVVFWSNEPQVLHQRLRYGAPSA